jgi:ferredoxin
MTIGSRDYFRTSSPDRLGEPDFLALIDRVACTSCQACALACPMSCIFEVEGIGQSLDGSYHAVDTSRCIGCQLCFRLVGPDGQLGDRLCPRDAIRMVPNPNVQAVPSPLRPYYRGVIRPLPWPKIEEFGRQLYLAREVRTHRDAIDANRALAYLAEPQWSVGGPRFPVVHPPAWDGPAMLHQATREGLEMLEIVFEG